jgi:ParB family chromosome partitioning protein
MAVKLPSDFARSIGESLAITPLAVETLFTVEEDKEGFFVARLKPQHFLENMQFRTMCQLVRDLGGKDYLEGAKCWKVPGPLAKKEGERPSGHGMDSESSYKKPWSEIPTGPSGVAPNVVTDDKSKPEPFIVPVDKLVSLQVQIRTHLGLKIEELAESIRTFGVLHPILVRRKGPNFEVIMGERRVAAVRMLGWKEIPATIRDLTDEQAYQIQGVENIDREDLTDLEKARWLDFMTKKFGYTQEVLAKKLGKSQPWISQHLAMLQIPENITRVIKHGELTEGQAREILAASPEKREEILDKINETGEVPSMRELEEMRKPSIPCARCGDPVQGPPVHLEGKFYCAECADQVQAESEQSLGFEPPKQEPQGPVGPAEPSEKREEKEETLLSGFEVECPKCKAKLLLEHVEYPGGKHIHRIAHEKEAET